MNSPATGIMAARAPRKINWRLARWWTAANTTGVTILAARNVEFYRALHASGYHAPLQVWASLAGGFY